MSLVLHASVTVAWLFEGERRPAADAVMAQAVRKGASLASCDAALLAAAVWRKVAVLTA